MSGNIQLTRPLLISGLFAGPIYITVGLVQIATRTGFDITRHPLSMLSLGDFGWVQIANFILTGTLVISGAIGLRRAEEGNGVCGAARCLLACMGWECSAAAYSAPIRHSDSRLELLTPIRRP